MSAERFGVVIVTRSGPGVLHELTGVIARHQGDIASVSIIEAAPAGIAHLFRDRIDG